MNIEQESLDGGFVVGHGGADAASKPIVAAGYANKAYKGVRVRAATANTVVIYVGPAGVKTTNGYPLPAGEELEIKIDNPFRINVVATPAANSQQTVTLAGQIAGDTFTLTCNGAMIDPIAVTANAATVQAALQGLSTIGIGNATVVDTAGGPPYTVTFTGALAKVDVNLMTAEGTGTNETQNITITNAEAGDKVVLTFGANSTDALAYDSTSAQIQTALRGLASIGGANVDVTDGATGWDVEFVGTKAKTDVGAISGVAGKNEVQNIEIIGGAAGDMLTLNYGGDDATPVAYNANTAGLQGALDSIAALTGKTVVTGNGPWDVEFIGTLAKTDVNMITGVCGRNEQQTVGLPDTVDTGTFTLTYDGDTTAPIAYAATATDVKNALELLDSIEEVAVTGGPGPTADWTIEFKGALARTDVDLMTATSACGRNEKQTIVVTDGLAGDTMVLTFGAESTGPLAYTATSAEVAAALKLMVAIGEGDVIVTDGDPAGWVVEFTNDLGLTDVDAITGVCGRNEKQTIVVTNGAAGDKLVLTYDSVDSSEVAYNADLATMQAALETIPALTGNVNVVAGDPAGWEVEFLNDLANTDVPPITGVGGKNEKQTIGIPDTVDIGTFTLTYSTQTTNPIAYDATAVDVQGALEGLAAIEVGDIEVTGGPGSGTDWVVEFKGNLAKTDVGAITATSSCGRNEKQRVAIDDASSDGTFTLTFGANTTGPIAYSATAGAVEDSLEILESIGVGNVSVTGGPGPGTDWIVEFKVAKGLTNVATMTGDGALLVGGSTDVTITEEVQGITSTVTISQTVTGNEDTVTVTETRKGNLATVTVTETVKGVTSTVTIAESVKGHGAAVAVAELAKGNTATVTVTETEKGDASCTVTVAKVGDITTGSQYSWIAL